LRCDLLLAEAHPAHQVGGELRLFFPHFAVILGRDLALGLGPGGVGFAALGLCFRRDAAPGFFLGALPGAVIFGTLIGGMFPHVR
jgi:hypothetical protein